MTTRVESVVRSQFALENPGEAFDPKRTLRWSIAPWEYRTPEEIALYDAYRRFVMWFAFDKGFSMAGTMPDVPAAQAALGVLGVPWSAILGPRSPPSQRSGFSSFLGDISAGIWDVAEIIRPVILSWSAGQILGATTSVIVPADAPGVLQSLATEIGAAAVEETTGVLPVSHTGEGVSSIWSSVITAVGGLGQTAIGTFGGDGTVQPTTVAGVTPTARTGFGEFISSPVGIGVIAAVVIGGIFVLRR